MSEFSRASFVVAAARLEQLPSDAGREVAFAGRSNAGKSSALNSITQRQALARVSKTPGRTRQLVVFEIDETRRLVDLPGYGFAKVSAATMKEWNRTLERYFNERESLAGLVLIMDVRHPLRDVDWQMLEFCRTRQLEVHALLTKADKLKGGRARATLHEVSAELSKAGFEATVQLFSSLKKTGVDAAQEKLRGWLGPPAEKTSIAES